MMKNESGRSMVEMLGVLAIIGVLSIGGIAGYTTAMNKYRANEVAQAVSMTVIQAKVRASNGAGTTANYATHIDTLPSSISSVVSAICADAAGDGTYQVIWKETNGGVEKAFKGSNGEIGEFVSGTVTGCS